MGSDVLSCTIYLDFYRVALVNPSSGSIARKMNSTMYETKIIKWYLTEEKVLKLTDCASSVFFALESLDRLHHLPGVLYTAERNARLFRTRNIFQLFPIFEIFHPGLALEPFPHELSLRKHICHPIHGRHLPHRGSLRTPQMQNQADF